MHRRALGDIGNLGNALSQKVHGGKDAAQVRRWLEPAGQTPAEYAQ